MMLGLEKWAGSELVILGLSAAITSCSSDDNPLPSSANAGGSGGQYGTGTGVGGQSSAGGRAPGGGTSSSTGNGGSAGVGTSTGPSGQCPTWPRERLFPYVGLHFYGPNPGPCTRTYALLSGGESSVSGVYDFAYDAQGHVASMTKRDGTDTTIYTLDQGLVTGYTDTRDSSGTAFVITGTYFYGTNSAGYSFTNPGSSTPSNTYTYYLDARGYPLEIVPTMASTSPAIPVMYVYGYDGCRISSRTAYLADNTVDSRNTWQYTYDAAGRIVTITGGETIETFDYSCW
jgi:YD repeat-containing protein